MRYEISNLLSNDSVNSYPGTVMIRVICRKVKKFRNLAFIKVGAPIRTFQDRYIHEQDLCFFLRIEAIFLIHKSYSGDAAFLKKRNFATGCSSLN